MEHRDEELWRIAKKRVAFKRHLATYIIMNAFFWAVWMFSSIDIRPGGRFPWPVWPMIGWGIGLAFNYFGAYHSNRTGDIEREYRKMKEKE